MAIAPRTKRAPVLVVLGVIVALVSGVFGVGLPQQAAVAASGADFDPGFIISDDTFFNSSTMSQQEVQDFLNSMVPSCNGYNGQSCLRSYTTGTASKNADSYCSAYSGSSGESAAAIIYKVGVACGINPQVLLVMLQKEQGLVTSSSPTSYMYRSAMGYGCPDTAACDSEYYGFQNQVYNAAHQFQRYTANSSSYSYQPGRNNQILYNPNSGCGTKTVFIQNQATANLYIYTPYTPNAAALNNMYGTGDGCSSYGNRNFFSYFSDWFGSPGNLLRSGSFEGGSLGGWGASNGFVNQALVNSPNQAQNGSWFLATNTPVSGRALSQDVQRETSVGQLVSLTTWVKSSGGDFNGKFVVWGLGGSNEAAVLPFTATSTWQQLSITLPIKKAGHTTLRLDMYLLTVGTSLWVDNSMMTVGAGPVERNLLSYPSFENAFTGWIPGNGFVNQQVFKDARAQDGQWFAASNTSVAGRSFAQDFYVDTKPNERYTFSIWLRSSDSTIPFDGKIALWALGGSSTPLAVTNYSVAGDWTQVDVSVDVGQSRATQLRVEVYMGTPGVTLWLDNGSLTRNILSAGSFESGSFDGWQRDLTGINYAVYSQSATGIKPAQGSYFAAFNTPTAGGSLFQDVKRLPVKGENYVAEVWVKSGSAGKDVKGTLAIWPFGGSTQVHQKAFTATSTWTLVSVPVPVTQEKLTSFRFQIYLDTVGATLHVDGAQLR